MRGTAQGSGAAGTCYLIHFDRPYRHARRYTGSTVDLEARLELHRAGGGARRLQVLARTGIGWTLARTWQGSRARQLKRQGGACRRCPICRAEREEAGR